MFSFSKSTRALGQQAIAYRADRWVNYLAFLYLSLPLFIFFLGWLQLSVAVPLSLLLGWGLLNYLGQLKPEGTEPISVTIYHVVIVAGIAFIWILQSGIGGFASQDWDHHFRNALFYDLIRERWPVYYSFHSDYKIQSLAGHDVALNYYLAFWLPAASLGKIAGQEVANICLVAWSYIGVLLSLYYTNRLFHFKYVILVSAVLMMWSGLDILGKLVLQKHLVYPGELIETYYYYYFTSFTVDLFNVFNQFVPCWLITVWVLNHSRQLNLLPIALLFPYAPFPFLGLSLFYYSNYLLDVARLSQSGEKGFMATVVDAVVKTRIQVMAALSIMLIHVLFYAAHSGGVPINLFWTRYADPDGNNLQNLKTGISYLITFFLEVGVYAMLIFLLARPVFNANKWVLGLCCGTLLLLPVVSIGHFNDLASRGSIPSLIILCILTLKAVTHWYEHNQRIRFSPLLVVVAFVFLLSWITPLRAFNQSLPINGKILHREAIGSFANPNVNPAKDEQNIGSSLPNFYAYYPQNHFFYQYLARQ